MNEHWKLLAEADLISCDSRWEKQEIDKLIDQICALNDRSLANATPENILDYRKELGLIIYNSRKPFYGE